MEHLLDNNRMLAVQIGGVLMILAALICYFIVKEKKIFVTESPKIAEVEIEGNRSV
jgi:maltose/moltooligosaccharide transporter